jgi:hypothetical protein
VTTRLNAARVRSAANEASRGFGCTPDSRLGMAQRGSSLRADLRAATDLLTGSAHDKLQRRAPATNRITQTRDEKHIR